jgi:parvulin-like peptidyl-prolyl isomerase
VSDIVETPLGFHLIKAGDRKPEMTTPFESLKDQIGQAMKLEKGKEDANTYIAKVRESAKVEIRLPEEK